MRENCHGFQVNRKSPQDLLTKSPQKGNHLTEGKLLVDCKSEEKTWPNQKDLAKGIMLFVIRGFVLHTHKINGRDGSTEKD